MNWLPIFEPQPGCYSAAGSDVCPIPEANPAPCAAETPCCETRSYKDRFADRARFIWEREMVGIQCKSFGHRALATPEPPKLDHEIVAQLRQSSVKCSACGGDKVDILTMPSSPDLADIWLTGNSS